MKDQKNYQTDYLILLIIMGVAFILRFWGLDFGLPHPFARPDEQSLVRVSLNMFSGDLNPHFFYYPSFFIYLLFVVYNVFYLLARLTGFFGAFSDFWILFFKDPSVFFLIPRYISLTASLLNVWVIFRLGKRFYSETTALIAALFSAVAFLLVREAHFGVTDTTLTLLTTLAVYYCVGIYEDGTLTDYLLAGLFSGLAFSTKYTAALLIFPVLTAVGWRLAREKKLKYFYKSGRFWLLIILGLLSFSATSPYAILDFKKFYEDFIFIVFLANDGHGINPTGYWYNLRFTLGYGLGPPLLILAGGGLIYWLKKRRPRDLIQLGFILIYFLALGMGKRPFVRYLLPMTPFLLIAAAYCLTQLTEFIMKDKSLLVWGSALLILTPSLYSVISFDRLISKTDTRVTAKKWLENNLPAGSAIAIDGLFYNNLTLTESFLQTRTRIDQWMPGFFDKYMAADFKDIYPGPVYEVYVISDFYSSTLEVTAEQKSSRAEAEKLYRMVKQMGARYLVTSEYKYLPLYTDNWVRLKPVLNGRVKLIKTIRPYNDKSRAVPQFDQIDALFVPYSGFKAINYPGPQINIYELL